MYICYVDESGDAGTFMGRETDTPVFVATALAIKQENIDPLTREWISLKRKFYPRVQADHYLDSILHEVKGEHLRKSVRKGSQRAKQHSIGFLDGAVRIAERHEVKLLGKALVKGEGVENSDGGFYASSMQYFFESFNRLLREEGRRGCVVADARRKAQNSGVAHCVFTQLFRHGGSAYPHVIEMPTFGHSNNHAMIQLVDVMCSAVMFPMVSVVYCDGVEGNVHVHPAYLTLLNRYREAIKSMQYRYNADGWKGGVWVTDARGRKASKVLFSAVNGVH